MASSQPGSGGIASCVTAIRAVAVEAPRPSPWQPQLPPASAGPLAGMCQLAKETWISPVNTVMVGHDRAEHAPAGFEGRPPPISCRTAPGDSVPAYPLWVYFASGAQNCASARRAVITPPGDLDQPGFLQRIPRRRFSDVLG